MDPFLIFFRRILSCIWIPPTRKACAFFEHARILRIVSFLMAASLCARFMRKPFCRNKIYLKNVAKKCASLAFASLSCILRIFQRSSTTQLETSIIMYASQRVKCSARPSPSLSSILNIRGYFLFCRLIIKCTWIYYVFGICCRRAVAWLRVYYSFW